VLSAQALSDHVEIAQLVQRYGKALDEKDYALLDSVFTPDAVTNYELGDLGNRTSYPQMRALFASFNAVFSFTQHLLSAPLVELDGDEATAETRLVATHGLERKSGEKSAWFVVGFYRDSLVRTPAGWRIRERFFQGLHTIGELPPAQELVVFEKPYWHKQRH
jgi:hypothetical protein